MKRLLLIALMLVMTVSCIIPAFAVPAKTSDETYSAPAESAHTAKADRTPDRLLKEEDKYTPKESNHITSNGYDYTYYYYIENSTAIISDFYYNYMPQKLTIPEKLGGYTVKTIGEGAFGYCSNLIEINLNKVTKVKDWAFYNCYNLSKITMKKVTSIGEGAFSECSYLNSFVVDNSKFKGDGAKLYSASKKTLYAWPAANGDITIPSSVTTIAKYAFYNNNNIKSVNTKNVTTIGKRAFQYCDNYNFSISMPKVKKINSYAFYGCELQSISMPKAETIGSHAFDNVYYYGKISIPCATSLGSYAFAWSDINSVYMPKMQTIGSFAFRGCYNIYEITIPKTVTSIADGAFTYCYNTKIKVNTENPYYSSSNGALYSKYKTKILAYPSAYGNKSFSTKVVYVAPYAFYGADYLTGIKLEGVTEIPKYAFYDCDDLEYATLPNCQNIGYEAFYDCDDLQKVFAPNCKSVGSYAFDSCEHLESIDLPNCQKIGKGAFYDCYKLKTVSAPNCKSVGSYAFEYCSGLRTVDITTVNKIYKYAFFECYNLESIEMPYVKTINKCAFEECLSLGEVVLRDVHYIGNYAFYNAGASFKFYCDAPKISDYTFDYDSNYYESYDYYYDEYYYDEDAYAQLMNRCAIHPTGTTGYTAYGWYMLEGGVKTETYANTHLVKFIDTYDNTVLRKIVVPHGGYIWNFPDVPKHTGYTLKGWSYYKPITMDCDAKTVY